MKLLLLITFLSFSVIADDVVIEPPKNCSEVNISTKNFPKNNDLNFKYDWCLFWTGADLLSFHEEAPLSSYDLALQYFNNDTIRSSHGHQENIVDMGGNITALLIVGQSSKGICLENQTNFTNGDWQQLSIMFQNILVPKKTLVQIMCEHNYQHASPFKEIPPAILKILNKLSDDKKAAALLDVTCGERHKFKNKYGVGNRTIEKFSDAKVIEKLDEILTRNGPATISYDLNFVKSGPEYTRDMEDKINHASTVIGRRVNPITMQCEYQIKDSVGNRCPRTTVFECDKSTGLMWVPRENLQKNIYEVNWLVKSKS